VDEFQVLKGYIYRVYVMHCAEVKSLRALWLHFYVVFYTWRLRCFCC